MMITCKTHCLNSSIYIYFRVNHCILHSYWRYYACVLGTEGVVKESKKEVERETWASQWWSAHHHANDVMLMSHQSQISQERRSRVQEQKLPRFPAKNWDFIPIPSHIFGRKFEESCCKFNAIKEAQHIRRRKDVV